MNFTFAQPVWYRQVSKGGYGYVSDVPAYYQERTSRRITVLARLRSGALRLIHVSPENVRPRVPPCASCNSVDHVSLRVNGSRFLPPAPDEWACARCVRVFTETFK